MTSFAVAKPVDQSMVTSIANSEKLIEALLATESHTPDGRASCRLTHEYPTHAGHHYLYVGVIEPLDSVSLNAIPKGSKANALSGHPGFALPTLLIQEGCCNAVVDLVKSLDEKGIQFVVALPRSSDRYDALDVQYITSRVLAECSGNVSIHGVEQSNPTDA